MACHGWLWLAGIVCKESLLESSPQANKAHENVTLAQGRWLKVAGSRALVQILMAQGRWLKDVGSRGLALKAEWLKGAGSRPWALAQRRWLKGAGSRTLAQVR